MNKNIVFLLVIIVLSLPFWAGINALQEKTEDFLYEKELASMPIIPVVAKVINYAPDYPDYYDNLATHDIQAESVIIVKLNKTGNQKTLFEKNPNKQLPIASLTKLVTAIVASEFYRDSEQIKVSETAVSMLEKTGFLKPGELITTNELLHSVLIESSNDAAYAITELMGNNGFIDLMNLKVADLNMNSTFFYNPSGLDPDDLSRAENEINHSTASDLVKLAEYLIKNHPKILEITSKEQYNLYLKNGGFHHTIYNTNELIFELNNIIGSKTGLTDRAGGCLLLILVDKSGENYYINIVLNSPDRFNDMRKLITLNNGYDR